MVKPWSITGRFMERISAHLILKLICCLFLFLSLFGLSGCYASYVPSASGGGRVESYSSMALSPSGDRLVVGSDQGVHVYQMEPFTETWFIPFSSGVGAVDFSSKDVVAVKLLKSERFPTPDPRESGHTVILFDGSTGSQLHIWDDEDTSSFPPNLVRPAFSPDGSELITAMRDNRLSIRNTLTGIKRTLDGPVLSGFIAQESIYGVAWTPTGKEIAFDMNCENDPVVLLDSVKGRLVVMMDEDYSTRHSVRTLDFNSTGTLLVGDLKASIVIWDVGTGKQIWNFKLPHVVRGTASWSRSAAFSPNDTMVVSGWYNGAIAVWNVETGEVVKTLRESGETVDTVLFYGNDRIITQSASEIKVWDLATGKGTTYLGGSAPAP